MFSVQHRDEPGPVVTANTDDELRELLMSHDWKPGQHVVSFCGDPALEFHATGGPLTEENNVIRVALARGSVLPEVTARGPNAPVQ